jgi:cytochrome d ubiquinol oxidase subunit I
MSKFWGKLFLINFAIGVVTGIVQEFQFGMNWSEYSRYVGDIFGAPLAIEALMAFFLESTFLGIWIFGEGKVSEKVHLASIWLAAIGSNLSALWILLANGFMQAPPSAAYVFNAANGRLELVNFFALIGNPKGWIFFWHTISDGLAMAAFLILAVSAYHIIRKQNVDLFKSSFVIGALVSLVASVSLFFAGHTMGQFMYENQPMKFASVEAHWETSAPAEFSILTIGDLSGKKEVWSIRMPAVLSFLACNNFTCEVKGVNDIQKEYEATYGAGTDYIPLMVVTYWTFRFMMTIGFFMIAASAFFLYMGMRGNLENAKWMKWVVWVITLPYIANASGWILTEMGRQPWIVQGLLKVQDASSPNLTTLDLWISLVGYVAVYGTLAGAMFYLMKKYAVAGPDAALHESVDVAPTLVGGQD